MMKHIEVKVVNEKSYTIAPCACCHGGGYHATPSACCHGGN
jgi:hypothetical protein